MTLAASESEGRHHCTSLLRTLNTLTPILRNTRSVASNLCTIHRCLRSSATNSRNQNPRLAALASPSVWVVVASASAWVVLGLALAYVMTLAASESEGRHHCTSLLRTLNTLTP